MSARAGAVLLAGLLAAAAGCSPSVNTAQVTVEAYISAVSLGDVSRILALSAPYNRELLEVGTPVEKAALEKRYRDRIEQGYLLWDVAKSTGELAPDPLGIAVIRSIGLGKEGAAALPMSVRFEEEGSRAVVRTRALTNYGGIQWARVPAGGRMYLMGMPFGRVVNFATGFDDPSLLELLATVELDWTLIEIEGAPRQPGAPGDWFVAKVEPLPETATAWSPPSAGDR